MEIRSSFSRRQFLVAGSSLTVASRLTGAVVSPEVKEKVPVIPKKVEKVFKNPAIKGLLESAGLRARAPDDLFERLLQQQDVTELQAQACFILANRNYYRVKRAPDPDTVARAIKYHERLSQDFPNTLFNDFILPGASRRGRMIAVQRLKELRNVQTH